MKEPKKIEYWRIIVGVISIVFIVGMWITKDLISVYKTAPKENIMPMIVTTVAVSVLKMAGIVLAVFFVRWLIGKIKSNKK